MSDFSKLKPYTRRRGDPTPNGNASVWYRGQLLTFFAEAEDTGGQITFFEGVVPKGYGPPPHTHTKEDEALYVLEGHIKAFVENEEFDGPAGTFIFLPRGRQHYFTLETDEARLLSFSVPGGGEGFFRALGEDAKELKLPPTPPPGPPPAEFLQKLGQAAPKYGIIFSRPPTDKPVNVTANVHEHAGSEGHGHEDHDHKHGEDHKH